MFFKNLFKAWNQISLVKQIIIGLLIGIVLAVALPAQLSGITVFGSLFVGALKAVAPVLVFFLVISAIYLFGTRLAALAGVIPSFLI